MTLEEKREFLRRNGWIEVLEDCWIDNDYIKISNPKIDYYLASTTTEHAYNSEVERQKKSIIQHDGVTYLVTTDPFELKDWVLVSTIFRTEVIQIKTQEDLEFLSKHNTRKQVRKIISCTKNDGMKHVGYLIIEKP